MKPPVLYALLAVGGTALFGAAFVGFSALKGAPLHTLPVLGALFEAPPPHPEPHPETDAAEHDGHDAPHAELPPPRSDAELARADIGVLGSFLVPSPYTVDQLRVLERELESELEDVRQRRAELARRELEVDQREVAAAERFAELDKLRDRLEAFDLDLRQREAEVRGDEQVALERETQSWKDLASFFADGDAEGLAGKLTQFSAAEAARILRSLPVERAGELVNALPPGRYREYLDAYRAASDG